MRLSVKRKSDADVAQAPKKARRKKSSRPKPITCYVLAIGDEGAILTYLQKGRVEGRWFVPNTEPDNLEIFTRALASGSKAPILAVLDTLDQTYIQQNLPPVSKFSVAGLAKRRLKREFGNTELKSFYPLERTEKKEWNFMLFAIEQPDYLKAWFAWIEKRPNRFIGIRALPLEIASSIEQLHESNFPGESHEWKFLVSHNKVSGYRQVITRDGKMIFTRLGQAMAGGVEVEAGAIEQEIISTLEYLKRIGLKDAQSLSLMIVAGQEVLDRIDKTKFGIADLVNYTPYRVAEILQLSDVAQEADKYGDVVQAAAIATMRKPQATLWTAQLAKINTFRNMFLALYVVGVLSLITCVGLLGMSLYDIWTSYNEASDLDSRVQQATQELDATRKSEQASMENLEQIVDMTDIYEMEQSIAASPSAFLLKLSSAIDGLGDPKIRVQSVEWSATPIATESPVEDATSEEPIPLQKNKQMAISGKVGINDFVPADIKSEAIEQHAKELMEKLKPYFEGYELRVDKIPGAKAASDTLDIDFSKESTLPPEKQAVTFTYTFNGKEEVKLVDTEASLKEGQP